MDSKLFKIKEAAEYTKTSKESIRRWIREGKISAIRTPGGHRRIRKDALDRFLQTYIKRENMAKKIVIVDDNEEILDMLRTFLEKENYAIVTAETGVKLGMIIISENPDLILLDVMMSDKNGYEICEEVKREKISRHIPVILITGEDKENIKRLYKKVKADDYLTKPFEMDDVLEKIKKYLGEEMVIEQE